MAVDLTDPAYWESAFTRSLGRFLMLTALSEEPRHGYELARRVTELSGGCCTPSDAMIYPAIRDLMAGGLIACEVDARGARLRKVCSLTDKGRLALRVAGDVWARYLPTLELALAKAREGSADIELTCESEDCAALVEGAEEGVRT